GELHRRHPHPTGGGMHQHPLPGLDARQNRQPIQRSQKHHRHTRGLHQRPPPRHHGHQPRIHHRLTTHHPPQPHHRTPHHHPPAPRTPHRQSLDRGTALDDHPSPLSSKLAAAGIHPQGHQHIPEVHPDRSHRHPHLPCGQLHRPGRVHHHVLQRAPTAG